MSKNKITVHPEYPIGEICPRIYSGFLEPIGAMVYGQLYNPSHPSADEQGFRQDWIEALKGQIPAVRLPGGNFVSGWRWKDSIGPMSERKMHIDLAWFQDIPVEVGHDEYLQWMEKIGSEPLYTINLGTGTIDDAIDIVEYTNLEGGTYWSDLRKKNGHEAPYGVKMWYLGNEVDGPWQIGSFDRHPKEYGYKANEISKAIKWMDPTIETAACVTATPYLYHYPEWDIQALQECYNSIDYISMHHYHFAPSDSIGALLGGPEWFEEYIQTEIGICDYVQTLNRSPRKMLFSLDEYAMSRRPLRPSDPGRMPYNQYRENHRFNPERKHSHNDPSKMRSHGPGGGIFGADILGALSNIEVLMTIMNHADRIKIGCMTSGLSAIAAIDRDHVWKHIIYYPFTQMIKWGRGTAMKTAIKCDTYDIPGYISDDTSINWSQKDVPYLQACTAWNEEANELTIFAVNRHEDTTETVDIDAKGFEGYTFLEHIELAAELGVINTYEEPDKVVPVVNTKTQVKDGVVVADMKPLSFNVFRFVKK